MERIIYAVLLEGQFLFFYTIILNIKFIMPKWKKLIVGLLIVLCAVWLYKTGIVTLDLFCFIMGLSFPMIYDIDSKQAYGMYFPIVGICASCNTVWDYYLYDKNLVNGFGIRKILCLGITYVILLILYGLKRYYKYRIQMNFTRSEMILFNVYTIFIGISMGGLGILQRGQYNHSTLQIYIVATTIICALIYYLSIKSILLNRRILEEQNKLIHQQVSIQSQKEQVEAIIENEQRLHAYRHDLNAHLNALYSLSQKKDIEGIKEYCEKLLEHSKTLNNVVISGNTVVDGILGRKLEKCDELGIKLNLQVSLLQKNKIADYELCIIFSNILNNAIEACEKGDTIDLVSYPYNEYLCIIEKNPTHRTLSIQDGTIQTTKSDKISHGHGLSNVKTVVNKYDGKMNIKDDNGVFSIEILL